MENFIFCAVMSLSNKIFPIFIELDLNLRTFISDFQKNILSCSLHLVFDLILSWIMVKNGQTYFKNLVVYFKHLAVFTPQDFSIMFGHFSTLCLKRLIFQGVTLQFTS